MNENLKWFAENMHEWPKRYSDLDRLLDSIAESYAGSWDGDSWVGINGFTRAQWQAARDELSGKPSWDDAPEWAQWLAQDEDGRWFWYTGDKPACKEPFFESSTPVRDDQDHLIASHGRVLGDWRDTLERRPENHSAEPTEKVWRGTEDGLPPVGVVCEMIHPGILDYGWQRVAIKAYFDKKVVIECSPLIWPDGFSITNIDHELKFRPIRSEEDVAVDEMVDIMKQDQKAVGIRRFAELLYRAGYRKQKAE